MGNILCFEQGSKCLLVGEVLRDDYMGEIMNKKFIKTGIKLGLLVSLVRTAMENSQETMLFKGINTNTGKKESIQYKTDDVLDFIIKIKKKEAIQKIEEMSDKEFVREYML